MTAYTPAVRVWIDGVYYDNVVEYDITLSNGRNDVTEQAQPGYTTITMIMPPTSKKSTMGIGKNVKLYLTNSSGVSTLMFTGVISDFTAQYRDYGLTSYVLEYQLTVVSVLSVLTRRNAGYVNMPEEKDGERVLRILKEALLTSWSRVSSTLIWTEIPTVSWADYDGANASVIDSQVDVGVYNLSAYNSGAGVACDLITEAANSGRGTLYCLPDGSAVYDDYAARVSAPIITLTNAHIDPMAFRATSSLGRLVNNVEVTYSTGSEYAKDDNSTQIYGEFAGTRSTSLKHSTEAATQAADFVKARAYGRTAPEGVTIDLINPALTDSLRNSLIGINMGYRVKLAYLPGVSNTSYDLFVENYTWRFTKGHAVLELGFSDYTETYPTFNWVQISALYTWTSYGTTYPTQNWTQVA